MPLSSLGKTRGLLNRSLWTTAVNTWNSMRCLQESIFVNSLPRTALGKIQRHLVARLATDTVVQETSPEEIDESSPCVAAKLSEVTV